MELNQVIMERRSLRAYKEDQKVEKELIEEMLRAAPALTAKAMR